MFCSTPLTGLFTLVTGLIIAVSASPLAPLASLKIASQKIVDGVENLRLVVTVTNTGDKAAKILNDPLSPLSNFPTDTFSFVNSAGDRPEFTGVKVKYNPQAAATVLDGDAFTLLQPGQSISVEHDISQAYNFIASGAGIYDVGANTRFFVVAESGAIETIWADANPQSIHVSGNLGVSRQYKLPKLNKRTTFVNCSSEMQADIKATVAETAAYAAGALSYLNATTLKEASPRYGEWFGSFNSSRWGSVLRHFELIAGSDFDGFTFDCTCTQSSTFAYVNPDDFGHITLCGLFWLAPLTGTDSKAGTIIHESSHFKLNGGTEDIVYGQAAARELARTDPDRAVANADSHEYFAENTPLLQKKKL